MRRYFLMFVFLLLLTVTAWGCATVNKSLDYYEACKDDQVCWEEMASAKDATSSLVSTAVSSSVSLKSVGEAAGFVIGNIVAFIIGVRRGKNLKKGV